jgi:PAS domain S-box-containing protein
MQIPGSATGVSFAKRPPMLTDPRADELRALLAAVVDSSDDAIVTKTLDGIITSWNRGAEQLFGYTAAEAIGQPIFLIIPDDRTAEEHEVLARLHRGERIEHFETVRQAKDGRPIPISLTVSPVKDAQGTIIGVSKVARDISDRIRAQEMAEQRRVEQERVALLTRLVLAQEDERRRIARELHDQLGQQLTALRLTLAALDSESVDPNELRVQLETLREVGRQLDEDIAFRVWELTPAVLENVGLSEALRLYVRRWSTHFSIGVHLHISASAGDRLASEVETMMYRVTQEVLNNVVKHARADRVDITLERGAEYVSLIIEDNGVGFNPMNLPAADHGLGLIAMRERAAVVGGELQIESTPTQGTTVLVRAPVVRAALLGS